MNARLYDAKLHRFLAPDNFIQDPSNSQSYNRYGYVWNNPLRYNDESGEVIWAAAIGAAIGVIVNGIMNDINNRPFFQGGIQAGIMGAISGAVSSGIGSAITGVGGSALQQAGMGVFLHGYSGGIMSGMSGGNFWSGFAAGSVGSGVASGIGLTGISNQYWMAAAQIGGATVSGGASSVLAGGNFWDGARQGFITAALNHVAHSLTEGKGKIKKRVKLTKDQVENWKLLDDLYIQTVTEKSMFGKYGGTALDFISAGGEIYITQLDYEDGTITRADFEFKMTKIVVKRTATLGAGLGLATGANLGRFGGIYGMMIGTSVGLLIDGAFWLSSKGEQWLNRWGNYIENQALYNWRISR